MSYFGADYDRMMQREQDRVDRQNQNMENAFWVQRDAQIQVNEFSRAFNQRPSGGSSESPAIGYGVMILGVLGYVAYQWLSGFFHSVFG